MLRDITGILLDPNFIERLIIGSKQKAVLTEEHCKFILNDFACCSLMRLDESSMSKLWDLITMIFKWQLEMVRTPEKLLEITFRHLDGVGQLHPSAKKTMLIDCTKNTIANFWNSHDATKQEEMFASIKCWFQPLNTKISVLIRLGFQNMDGTLTIDTSSDRYAQFINNIGENVYIKNETSRKNANDHFKGLAEQLHIAPNNDSRISPFTKNLLFGDAGKADPAAEENVGSTEFVQLKTVHKATSSWESLLNGKMAPTEKKNLQALLNMKLS